MKRRNKAILAAGMLAGSCALTGCASGGAPQPTPSPDVAQQQSAEPSPEASAEPKEEASIPLWVDGREAENAAVEENGALLLPLIETGEALGWTAESEELTEETQIRRSVALTKDNSKISVTWMVSDNTASAITWQKDGLLIPVDTRLTTLESVVYVCPRRSLKKRWTQALCERKMRWRFLRWKARPHRKRCRRKKTKPSKRRRISA